MFRIKRKPFQIQQTISGAWLGQGDRLFTLKLTNAQNPLDPTSLWVAQYAGGRDIVESVSGSSGNRLQAALDRHRCSVVRKDVRSHLTRKALVFCDVVVWMNGCVWRQDAQKGGPGLETLTDNLARLHKEHFGEILAYPRKPSYAVMPNDALSADTVVFQFGLGVFAPHPEDCLKAGIHLQIEDKTGWIPIPEWIFLSNGETVERSAGIYEGQQFLILGPGFQIPYAPHDKAVQSVWFDHGQGFIFFNLNSGSRNNAFGDGEFVSDGEFISYNIRGKSTVYVFRDLTGSQEQLLLKVTDETVQEAELLEEDATAESLPPPMEWDGDTFIAGLEQDRLVMEGIALPRFDAPGLKRPDLDGWTIWIDEYGQPVNTPFTDPAEKEKLLALSASSDENYLSYRKPGENLFTRVIDYPLCFTDIRNRTFEVVSSPVPERFHGVLQLSDPVFEPLDQTSRVVGRPVPRNAPSSPDIQLRSLMHPESITFRRGHERTGAHLGAIWLSREHIRVSVKDGKLHISMTKGSMPVFGIDADGGLKWTLQPRDAGETILETGERMLIGCYLIRFERV